MSSPFMPFGPMLLATLVAATAGNTRAQDVPRMMVPEAFEVVRLADGVHAVLRRDPSDDAANANVLVIVNEQDAIVVDATITPASTEATIAAIRRLTPNPVRYVITTHWHDDHVLGNGAYVEAFPGVEFIGHPYTRQRMLDEVAPKLETNRRAYRDVLADLEKRVASGIDRDGTPLSAERRTLTLRTMGIYRTFLAEMPRIRIVPPAVLVGESLTIRRGEREIRVRFLGRGNTAGDLVVHLPREGIVATGDLLVHPIPFSFGSYLGEWIETLDRVKALGATVVMPGHGELQRDTRYLSAVQELLGAVRTQMREAVAKGLTLEQAREALDLTAYRGRFAGDDPVRNRQFTNYFVVPASERAYLEAKGELTDRGIEAPAPF